MRNKTSTITAEKSLARIRTRLADMGASGVSEKFASLNGVNYTDSLSFSVPVGNRVVNYRLPARVSRIYDQFVCKRKRGLTGVQEKALFQQAYRTAWKLIWEWVDIQATMIGLEQVEAAEVFMPYLIVGKDNLTLYAAAMASGKYGQLMLEENK